MGWTVDLAAFRRYFTSNADLAGRILRDKPIKVKDRKIFYTPGIGYILRGPEQRSE